MTVPIPLKKAVIVFVSTILIAAALVSGCSTVPGLTARQVLERSVTDLMALKSYRYQETSSLSVPTDKRLDSSSTFETLLAVAGNGALDGHMVVKSDSYSCETYSYKSTEYTRVAGQGWCRADKGASDPGYGMVTAGARRIIARYADLVEDVRFTHQTPDECTVTMLMGKKYAEGARAIAGNAGSQAPGTSVAGETRMTLVVGRKDLRMRSVVMTDSKSAGGATPAVTIVTRGTYTEFNKPVDVRPPAEALSSREVSAEAAPPTRQAQ